MYKNDYEKIKANKRDSANIAIAILIMLIAILMIAYFAGMLDRKNDIGTVEKFNTSYMVGDSTWITKEAYEELETLLEHYEVYAEDGDIYFIKIKDRE